MPEYRYVIRHRMTLPSGRILDVPIRDTVRSTRWLWLTAYLQCRRMSRVQGRKFVVQRLSDGFDIFTPGEYVMLRKTQN
jgi:hypothetical protein